MNKESVIYKLFRTTVYRTIIHPREYVKELYRKTGKSHDYSFLEKYKDIHLNKRCFIIATGPSLTEEDYISLKNEITIGVNGLCLWFDKTGIETNYFVVSDEDVYDKVHSYIESAEHTISFISERVAFTRNIYNSFNLFPVDLWNRFALRDDHKRLSNNISICSYDEETVVFHAIQLAIYMGIKEIYLLGTDCNYNLSKVYAVDHGKKADRSIGPRMIKSYEVVKRFEDIYGFRVYNATRGGMLEVFPRVNFDSLL